MFNYRVENKNSTLCLVLPKDEYEDYSIGKYARLRLNYLKENRKAEYTIMLMDGILRKHIIEIEIEAKRRIKSIIEDLKSKSNLTEEIIHITKYVGLYINDFLREYRKSCVNKSFRDKI